MGARVSGVNEVADALARLEAVPAQVRTRVLSRKAKELLQRATELAPTDDDPAEDARADYVKLRESGKVLRRKNSRIVRFATRHAAAQHEWTDVKHEEGQPKFLEQPLREMRPTLMRDLAADAEAMVARIARRASRRSRSTSSTGGSGTGVSVPPLRDSRGRYAGAAEE